MDMSLSPRGLIRVPSVDELVDLIKKETIPVTIVVVGDKLYIYAGENEGFYKNIVQKLGKWSKPVIYGVAGGITLLVNNRFIRKIGGLLLGYGLGETIDKLFINKQYVIVKKTDTGLEFDLEGFDTSQTAYIYLNGTLVAQGETDAEGKATITVDGTVSVEATELAVVCGSTTFRARIPYNISPTYS